MVAQKKIRRELITTFGPGGREAEGWNFGGNENGGGASASFFHKFEQHIGYKKKRTDSPALREIYKQGKEVFKKRLERDRFFTSRTRNIFQTKRVTEDKASQAGEVSRNVVGSA